MLLDVLSNYAIFLSDAKSQVYERARIRKNATVKLNAVWREGKLLQYNVLFEKSCECAWLISSILTDWPSDPVTSLTTYSPKRGECTNLLLPFEHYGIIVWYTTMHYCNHLDHFTRLYKKDRVKSMSYIYCIMVYNSRKVFLSLFITMNISVLRHSLW